MYKLQLSLVRMNQHWQQAQALPAPTDFGIVLREVLPCRRCGGFCSSPSCAGPGPETIIYEDIPSRPTQHTREPNSGPSRTRNHRNGLREAEPQHRNHIKPESSESFLEGSTGFDLGVARIGANNETGGGKQMRRKTPYDRDNRRNRNIFRRKKESAMAPSPSAGDRFDWQKRGHEVDPSVSEGSKGAARMAGDSPVRVASSTSMSISAEPISYAEAGTILRDGEQINDEEEPDTVSLGFD